jgi:membrane-associated phospholipid phosphatase
MSQLHRFIAVNVVCAVVVVMMGAGRAEAEAATTTDAVKDVKQVEQTAAPPKAATPQRPVLAWAPAWPRFRTWEYVGTALVGVTSWYVRNYRLPPQQARWQGSNAFDDTIRGWLRADTREGRERASAVSGPLTYTGYVVPFGVDLGIVLVAHREPRLMWQLLMLDLEAFAVSGLVNNTLFYVVGRARPSAPDCAANPAYDDLCGVGANASMPSGHTLVMATGAGLTCVHHHYLPIYGDGVADGAACALMSLVMVATATTRIMADRHYASDTLLGMAVGFGSGYGLPWLLHYRPGVALDARDSNRRAVALVPFASSGQLGLGMVGTL